MWKGVTSETSRVEHNAMTGFFQIMGVNTPSWDDNG
jgi:hypothetical protein